MMKKIHLLEVLMLLSKITSLNVCVGKTVRGVCLGVGVSLKSFAVKYLLCADAATHTPLCPRTDFAVNASAIQSLDETAIVLSRLRPVLPKNCAKIFIGRPVYSNEGVFLGHVSDLEIHDLTATNLLTDQTAAYPLTAVAAFSDAVILRKEQPYPLGQRIPAPVVLDIFDKNEPVVTKATLRKAIEKRSLIKLTLSLAPFEKEERKSR